jgi:hypothetical protein
VSTHVNVPAIRASFETGGNIGRNIAKMGYIHEEEAKKWAPYRTGRLRNLHFVNFGPVEPQIAKTYHVGTHADYAIFLLGTRGGRSGVITPTTHGKLELRPIPYSWFKPDSPGRFRTSVSGQNRNAHAGWLKKSLFITLARMNVLTIDQAFAQIDKIP